MLSQLSSNPVMNLLEVSLGTIVIDFIFLYYIYRKNKFGIGFKLTLSILIVTLMLNVSDSIGQFFGNNAMIFQTLWGAIDIILIGYVIYFILTNIINPINSLAQASDKIAQGNLNTKLPELKTNDETFRLRNTFEKMNEFLKSIVKELQSSTQVLSTSSKELASSSEQVNASSEEISSITQRISQSAHQQNLKLNELVSLSNNLKITFDNKISEINIASSLIENISSQVNMLSLNASIEAARAGEYGRGFSVVAENIRKLADESKNSVNKVQITIDSLSTELMKSLNDLINSIDTLAILASDTASGSEEASAATEEQAATMQEITASAQELANLSTNLDNLLVKFQI